ncbi:ABC transporter ATP-binding protein [Clostridiales bacterium COT073_COT-073]|nr:ABC transporter ATP-binding protein [Clostridiales bacterium COT073_COT-073]
MPEIILKNIRKQFGDQFVAVDNLNMVIEDRSFITLLGPSGCGKTTTLRMIAGLETPTAGQIMIDGKIVFDAAKGINVSPDKRDVGFLFQNYALWPHMTVYKNIAFGLENLKWSKAQIEERVKELLKMLRIEEFAKRYPSELSGGQQQRVAIARTLAPNPKVLFMDEPLSNLDAKLRGEMRTELKRLHVDTNSTFVYVTHDQLEAMTLSTNVCLMENGKLQQFAPPLKIYTEPENVFVADFMGNPTINLVEAKAVQKEKRLAEVDFCGIKAKYISKEDLDLKDGKIILGIRPEHIAVNENQNGNATIYTTLPTGMETTLKLLIGDKMFSAIVFGSVDYETDQKVDINFLEEKILMFDPESKKRIAIGKLEI